MDNTEARALILMLDAIRLEMRAGSPTSVNGFSVRTFEDAADARADLALALTEPVNHADATYNARRISAAKKALAERDPPIASP